MLNKGRMIMIKDNFYPYLIESKGSCPMLNGKQEKW